MPIIEEIIKVIENYCKLIRTKDFVRYKNIFASKLKKALINEYNKGSKEPNMVSAVVDNINKKLSSFSINNRFEISTTSIFIHGPSKGQETRVEFDYYGKKIKGELGDLIFILSVVYKNKKYFEKFTISQFKKDEKDDNKLIRWNLRNKKQVYLLSRFPTFKGVKGSIIPMKEFNLPNCFGCLGSFNLLYKPGDFVFISASLLETLLGKNKSISLNKISYLGKLLSYYLPFMGFCCWKIMRYECGFYFPDCYFDFKNILGFSHYAYKVYDFVDKYLRGFIGELAYSPIGWYNKPAGDFLKELLLKIRKKAKEKEDRNILSFIDEFFKYSYVGNQINRGGEDREEFDYEGGGIGIIHVLINLGEE